MKNIYEWPITTQVLILGLISAVVLYLGFFFDLSDLNDQLSAGQHQESENKQQLERIINKELSLKKGIMQLEGLENLLKQWQQKFIRYAEFPELLNSILKIGAANQVHFNLFTPGTEIKDSIYMKVPIKVVVTGDYHQLAGFISQIANMPTIVALGNFTIERNAKSSVTATGGKVAEIDPNMLTAELTLEVYRLAEKTKS